MVYCVKINKKINKGLDELNQLSSYLEKLNISDLCIFTPTLARGQNYYTGNVFEVYEKNGKITCSIGAGGRYDSMVTSFINDGTEYPTVGISFGLSSIYELLKDRKIFAKKSNIDIYIIPMGTSVESLKLANDLRCLGYKVEIQMQDKKLKKSLDYANKENIPYVIILGENELSNNKIVIKDMFNKESIEVSLDNLEVIKQYV